MPQHRPAQTRVCPACDGFAAVAITLGGRNRAGHLNTITTHCRTCDGTGTLPSVRGLLNAAATATFTPR
ncbi:hypothetical protein ACFWZY_18350 [Streptomyces sp. NPDC058992]|uniref:hypothetical protein n=1 Tax=Streptomyces sp. NPDC058992 TaxID=3346688 RepID=UPI0036BD279B